ncbi:HNH endonuclease [Membranicola marinus]|uniref:HNH endonuclease n=1 Tax=Membranihabitans marinus TaxID=1227546 RepID=A0A953HM82_9BACT|nr:HNH endonuclease [Membranihabitans marinus]MBY5958222.1 HNH endonuclease [Membranihabitans marinus]
MGGILVVAGVVMAQIFNNLETKYRLRNPRLALDKPVDTIGKNLTIIGISSKTRKNLCAKSGNRCSICRTELFAKKFKSDEENIGEECHIISSKQNGPRHHPNLDDYDNLILLCRNHHKEIDEISETFSQ